MQYPKKSKEFILEFLIPLNFDIFAIQLNFIAQNIVSRLQMLVVILLLKLLYMLEIFFAGRHQLFELGC